MNKRERTKRKYRQKHRKKYQGLIPNESRTKRKKSKRYDKERRARNKKLITLYPWLAPDTKYCRAKEERDYDWISLWDEVPRGWLRVFGRMMCDEIEQELEKAHIEHEVHVEQAKEKYGGLRLYMPGTSESLRIISIYEEISQNVCCICGKPHSPMLNLSWISPYCKECYERTQQKFKGFTQKPYEEVAPKDKDQWRIPDKLRWKRYSKEDGEQIIEVDTTDRIKQIELNYQKTLERRKKNERNK